MTDQELADTLDALHWSNRRVADLLNCSETLIRKWLAGRAAVPPAVAAWLRRCATLAATFPAPPVIHWPSPRTNFGRSRVGHERN